MGYGAGKWIAVRTFASTQAEAVSVARAATFVGIGSSSHVEFRARWEDETGKITTAVGAGTCTSATIALWRVCGLNGTGTAGQKAIDKIGTMSLPITANALVPTPALVVECGPGAQFYVTIESFAGGATTPAITGVIDARPVGEP